MTGIIGAGNMGAAIASRVKGKVLISDADPARPRAIKNKRVFTGRDNVDLAKRSDIIIIAVKPQDIDRVLREIRPWVKGKLVISIAAGVSTKFIEKTLGGARVIRVMPNLPLLANRGMSAITAGRRATGEDMKKARGIFAGLGEVAEVRENLMDAVTALSGSGPAYYFLFTSLLAEAGEASGLRKDLADRLAKATFTGAARLAESGGLSMADFVKKVASKGGTTEAALKVFKRKKLGAILKQAVAAAMQRSRNLTTR